MPKQTFFNLPAAKRERILDAAIHEFAGRGYKLSSISAIVAAAGIAKGSFYQYFEDKDDLYGYIITTMIAEQKLLTYEQQKGRLADLSLTGFLRLVFRIQMEQFQHKPQLIKIGLDLMRLTGEPVYQKLMGRYQGMLSSYFLPYIRHEVEQGEIDPRVNARMLNFMLVSIGQYLLHLYDAEGERAITPQALDHIVDDLEYILTNGIFL